MARPCALLGWCFWAGIALCILCSAGVNSQSTTWAALGSSPLMNANVTIASVAVGTSNGNSYIAYVEKGTKKLFVAMYDTNAKIWTHLGGSSFVTDVSSPSMIVVPSGGSDSVYVCFRNNADNTVKAYRYAGSWSQFASFPAAGYSPRCVHHKKDNSVWLAYASSIGGAGLTLKVCKFDNQANCNAVSGTEPSLPGFVIDDSLNMAIDPLGNAPHVVYGNVVDSKFYFYGHKGTHWEQLSTTGLTVPSPQNPMPYDFLTFSSTGTLYFGYISTANSRGINGPEILKYTNNSVPANSQWLAVGALTDALNYADNFMAMVTNPVTDAPLVAYVGARSGSTPTILVDTFRPSTSSWVAVSSGKVPSTYTNPSPFIAMDIPTGATATPTIVSAFGSTLNGYKMTAFQVACAVGYFANASNLCEACPAGRFSTNAGGVGLASCSLCPAGSYSNSPASTTCTYCGPGTFGNVSGLTSCYSCRAGTFSSVQNQTSESTCVACSAGQFSASSASTSCSICLAGTYSPQGSSGCTTCALGTVSGNMAGSCITCSAGTYSNQAGTACSTCLSGRYSAAGASICSICVAGTFSAPNSSQCTDCLAGTFSSGSAVVCQQCAAGSFAASTRSSSCTLCAVGTYQPANGASSYLPCSSATTTGSVTCDGGGGGGGGGGSNTPSGTSTAPPTNEGASATAGAVVGGVIAAIVLVGGGLVGAIYFIKKKGINYKKPSTVPPVPAKAVPGSRG